MSASFGYGLNERPNKRLSKGSKMMKLAAVIFAGVLAMAIANAEEAKTEAKTETKAKTETAKTEKKSEKKFEKKETAKKADKPAAAVVKADLPKDVKKLIVQDTIVGAGKIATKGKKVKVNYTGWLYDPSQAMGRGKQFDSSVGREPFTFTLGGGEVIKGWDDGFDGMKVGGKRKLIIPSEMGYGANGAGTAIPANAPLMFEVELVDVM
jgi:FKBP-type peptidyl-prolyl cis-trans isomerase FkpA